MSSLPTSEDHDAVLPDQLQHAALAAKLNEWGLEYTVNRDFVIADVVVQKEAQVREATHIAPTMRVEEYSQQMRNGAIFPPVILRTPNVLIDGNTRLAAAKRIGRKTFPALIVDTKTKDTAKILAAALNQMGGERLNPSEAHEAALLMMRNDFPDAVVARELGRDLSQVRRWRNQRDVEHRAEQLGLGEEIKQISRTTLGTLAGVSREEPFVELVKLMADVRPKEKDAKQYVTDAMQAPSDEEAVAAIVSLREELAPVGPPPKTAARRQLPLIRAAIGNLLKIEGNPDVAFNPASRDEELARWEHLRRVVDEVLAALREGAQ
jgi:ParB-like chromosome segregation protein Spo0J